MALPVLLPCLAMYISLTTVVGGATFYCEEVPMEYCAFAVSSNGARCVLEKNLMHNGRVGYECQTSSVVVGEELAGYIETDECVRECGVERMHVGLSTDALHAAAAGERHRLAAKLCSPRCQAACPNIFNLFSKLASGEGVYLPKFCKGGYEDSRRFMMEGGAQSPGQAPLQFPNEEDQY